jgi:DNA-binding transcriptional LysR family regulator
MTLTQLEIFSLVDTLGHRPVSGVTRHQNPRTGTGRRIVPTSPVPRRAQRHRPAVVVAGPSHARVGEHLAPGSRRRPRDAPRHVAHRLAILERFRALHPGIEVHVDEGPDRQVLQWLDERRIDVGFVVLPEERFDTFALMEDQMVALLHAAHPLAAQTNLKLGDLCNDPFILTEAGSSELVWRLFNAARLTPNVRYRCSQLLSTLDIVSRGDAVSVVSEGSLPPLDDPRIAKRALSPRVPRQIGLAVLDRRQASPATLAFIELAQALHPV